MALTKEQLEVINHGKGNILVSASAGSGKTHTMVSRLIRLIAEENVSVSEVLAVTFTESAAADMKEKLRKAVSDKIADGVDNETKKRLTLELGEIPGSDISTLHAFCGRLIRRYFFSAGLSPDFKIADEAESAIIRSECVEKTFKEFYDANSPWFLSLVDRYAIGRTDKKLKELVLKTYRFCAHEADPISFMAKSTETYSEEGLRGVLSEIKLLLNQRLTSIAERLSIINKQLIDLNVIKGAEFTFALLSDVKSAINEPDLYRLKKYADYKLKLNFERKLDAVAEDLKEQVKALRVSFIRIIKNNTEYLSDIFSEDLNNAIEVKEHTENLIRIVSRFRETYSEQKREENVLDFNDLEHFALKVLSDESVLEEVKNKYKYVFVDEYQDTNGVQEEIISKLENDNLFMVGDVKQSIYGFRGCRSEFFTQKDAMMSARGEKVVRLNANFRSAKQVINAVNLIFRHAMIKSTYGEDYKGRSELIPGGIYPDGADGRAELHFFEISKKEAEPIELPRIYNPLDEKFDDVDGEVAFLSKHISEIIESELQKTYYDPKEKAYKKITYGDIAILTRNRNNAFVNDLVSGLVRRGVPVASDVEVNVCDYPEIKMLINLLKLIDCFSQDLPLASTLKSPVANVTDEELYKIARFYEDAKGRDGSGFSDAYIYYLENADDELCLKLKEFNGYIEKIRFLSDFIGAGGILKKVVTEKSFKSYLYAGRDGREKVNRLNRFISATEIGGKTLTVKEFLDRIENCPEAFGLSYFATENTVKAMTIHASKGLEFPVVIVCGMERNFNSEEEREDVLMSRDYGFATKRYFDIERSKKDTPLRALIRAKMRKERVKEEMRLFYVALTRATYSLHMTFSGRNDLRKMPGAEADCFIKFVPESFPLTLHDQQESAFSEMGTGIRKVLIGSPDAKLFEQMKKRVEFSYPYLSDTVIPLKNSVTAVANREAEEGEYVYVMFDEETTDKEKGTIAHKLLENFDFDRISDFENVVLDEVNKGIISKGQLSKINLQRIRSALSAEVFGKISDKKLYMEKSFLVNVEASKILDVKSDEPVLVQGIIDLLAVGEKGAYVVDYKYSTLTKESLAKKYKKQLDLYAYAVEKILNVPVIEKVVVNLFTGESVTIG